MTGGALTTQTNVFVGGNVASPVLGMCGATSNAIVWSTNGLGAPTVGT